MLSLLQTSAVATAITIALASSGAIAQENASLFGKVSAQDEQTAIKGGRVEIAALNRVTFTRADGTFRFSGLETGEYEISVSFTGAATATQRVTLTTGENIISTIALSPAAGDLEEVIVRGQRGGKANAINQQRNANNIISVVSADSIGDFPDQNAAESLQRLPGISIERDQGEGRFVSIRGIDPNLNSVTINGLNVPSPEAGVRSVALDVIPSELIQTLEVSKSTSADADADSVGGAINVRSISAFDKDEDTTILAGQLSQNTLRKETSPKASVTLTRKLSDTFGIATALSYFNRDFGSDNVESNGDDEVEQRFYTINRERLGAALNLDFRPNFNDEYFIRTLYSKFADDESRLANIFTIDGEDSEIEREVRDRKETQTIFTLSAGGEHQRNQWLFDYQIGYAKSDEKEPAKLEFLFKQDNPSVQANINQQIPSVTANASAANLAEFELDEIEFENNLAEDTETSLQGNATYNFTNSSGLSALKGGFKYRSREKTVDSKVFKYGGDFDDVNSAQFASSTPNYGLGSFGTGINKGAIRAFFNQQVNNLELEELDSELDSKGATNSVNEDILALYFMGQFDWNKLYVEAGVRYEKTKFETNGNRVELVEDEENDVEEVRSVPFVGERNYDDFFLSANARYELTDKVVLRAAFSQTISRPIFEQSAAFQIIESKTEEDDGEFVTEREAEVGNPELKPISSNNFDLSIEYYPDAIGVLSAGLFYKDIEDFVIVADVAGTAGFEAFDEVFQAINGDDAKLKGVELSWVKTFENGLLISANGTFSSSDATTFLDGERFDTSLPNQSDQVGNFTIGYEDNTWSLRLTTTYKSKNLDEIDGDLLRFEDSHKQVDFTGKYFFNDDLNLYFNAININNEPFYNYFNQRNRNAQYEEYGRTFEIGVRWQL